MPQSTGVSSIWQVFLKSNLLLNVTVHNISTTGTVTLSHSQIQFMFLSSPSDDELCFEQLPLPLCCTSNIHNCETYTIVKHTQLWLVKIKSRQHSKVKIKPEKLYKSCYYYYCYYYYYSTQRVQNDASAKPLNVSPATCDLWHFASKLLCYNGHLPCACQLWVKWLRYFEISHQTEFLWSILA